MYRGTTPKLMFQFPFETASVRKLTLAFSQGGEVILLKQLEDFVLDGNNLSLKLSEEDTLKFDSSKTWVELQFRLAIENEVLASKIMKVEVKRILYDEVLLDEV